MELCRQSPDGPEPPEATICSVGRKDELSAVPPGDEGAWDRVGRA